MLLLICSKQVSLIKSHSNKSATLQSYHVSLPLFQLCISFTFRLYLRSSTWTHPCYLTHKGCSDNDALYDEFPEDMAGF